MLLLSLTQTVVTEAAHGSSQVQHKAERDAAALAQLQEEVKGREQDLRNVRKQVCLYVCLLKDTVIILAPYPT